MVFKYRIKETKINSLLYRFNKKSYFYLNPLNKNDFFKICKLIYLKELQYKKTILKTYGLKEIELFNLKTSLNLKKKYYINLIREIYNKDIDLNNISNLKNIAYEKKFNLNSFKNDLNNLSIFKKEFINNIEYYKLLNLFKAILSNNLFNKLINVNNNIKALEVKINDFKIYYNTITNKNTKINYFDLKQLKKGIYTNNIKVIFYFYINKLKKSKTYKNIHLNEKLNEYIKIGLINKKDKYILLKSNLLNQYSIYKKDLNNNINKRYQIDILNKYI